MWLAAEDDVAAFLTTHPTATPGQIDTRVCILVSPHDRCNSRIEAMHDTIKLAPNLFATTVSEDETGTVFIIGPRDGKPSVLWSIHTAQPQSADPHGLITAWQIERASDNCREKKPDDSWDLCGPLYASLGILSPDVEGRPRFYIGGGYAQSAGFTIGKQMSVWRWDEDHPTLLWIESYSFMIDQKTGDRFANGIFTIGQKEDFRTFYSCGMCNGRQIQHRLRLTPTGIEDLGKRSLSPTLDLVDELLWRLGHNRSTSDIASAQVAKLLKPQFESAKSESEKISPGWESVGMLDDTTTAPILGGKRVCFTADSDLGRLYFTLRRQPGGHYRFTHVSQPQGSYGNCPRGPGIIDESR